MSRTGLKNTALATILSTTLAACGGGGGGGSSLPISFDPPANINISFNSSISNQLVGSFVSMVHTLSADEVVDMKEALVMFKWIETNQSKFDSNDLSGYTITVDGQEMSLDKGFNMMLGFKKKYYDGKETFWVNTADSGTLDDENEDYLALKTTAEEDNRKSKQDLYNELEQTGKATVVSTASSDTFSYTYGTPVASEVISHTEWTLTGTEAGETSISTVSDTETTESGAVYEVVTETSTTPTIKNYARTKTEAVSHTKVRTTTKFTTTITTYSNGAKSRDMVKIVLPTDTVAHGTPSSTDTLETKSEVEAGTPIENVTRTLVTNPIIRTDTLDPTESQTVAQGSEYTEDSYVDGDETSTYTEEGSANTSHSYTYADTDVDNNNGTITRTNTKYTVTTVVTPITTHTTKVRTTTTKVYKDVTTTTVVTPRTQNFYADGTDAIVNGTPNESQAIVKTFLRQSENSATVIVSSEVNDITTTSTNSGEVVSVTTISTAYTDLDTNLGTKTTGYNTDETTYETDEYKEDNNGFAGGSYTHINASSAYSKGWTGKNSIVAVADTGYDTDHSEFDGQVIATKDYTGTGIQDNHGHGSHVLGTMVAKKDGAGTHGVAFDSKAVVIKIGDSSYVNLDNAAAGFSWAADQGAMVGNLSANSNYDYFFRNSIVSLGDGNYKAPTYSERNVDVEVTKTRWIRPENGDDPYEESYTEIEQQLRSFVNDIQDGDNIILDYNSKKYYNTMTPDAWKASTDKGMILVNSAGNQGLDISAMPGWFATETNSDGSLVLGGKVLIVGSYNFNSNAIDGFSNKAGHLCRVIVDNACTDTYKTSDFYVLAPGNTYSTDNDGSYGTMSGTSMAAPIVTGQIAILHQMWPHMKGENLVKLVTTTSDKTFTGYNVNIHGQGIVDFDEATQPQGAIGIPTTGRVDGGTSSVSGSGGSGSTSVASAISNIKIMVIDDYDRDYYMSLGNSFTVKDNRKYSDVDMLVENKNTFLPQQQMYGSFAQGGQWDMIKNYNFGLYTGDNGSGDYSINVGKNFYINNKFKLKTSLGHMSEQDTWLGNSSDGVLAVGDNNDTTSANIGVAYQLGNNVLTLDYSKGFTDVNTVDDSLIKSFSDIETESYRLAYEIHKDKHTTFGWSFSLPSHITSGTMDLEVAESVNIDGTINYANINSNLKQTTKEKNIGFYFTQEPKDTFDAGIKFTTEYRQDIAGENGKDGLNFAIKVVKKLQTSCKFLWMKNPKCFEKDANGKEVLKANLFGKNTDNATAHGLVYDLETDKFVPIKK